MRELAPCDVSVAISGLKVVSKGPSTRAIGAALGLSHTAIRKLHDKQGMPVDSIESAKAWYARYGHRRGGAAKMETPVETPAASFQAAAVSAGPVPNDLPSQADLNRMLTAARVRVTELEAEQAKVDGEIRDGLLVKAEDVKRIGMARAAALRDMLLGLPAELAIQLAAITDPALVADLLRKRLKAALVDYCAAYGVTATSS